MIDRLERGESNNLNPVTNGKEYILIYCDKNMRVVGVCNGVKSFRIGR